jgi:hypothetical protein
LRPQAEEWIQPVVLLRQVFQAQSASPRMSVALSFRAQRTMQTDLERSFREWSSQMES